MWEILALVVFFSGTLIGSYFAGTGRFEKACYTQICFGAAAVALLLISGD